MKTEETRELINDYYQALGAGDKSRLMELLAEDCEWCPPKSAPIDPIKGHQQVADFFTGSLAADTFDLSKPFNSDIKKIIVEGGTAVVQNEVSATTKIGRQYLNQYCWVYECADGKILSMVEYTDTLNASHAMGWDAN